MWCNECMLRFGVLGVVVAIGGLGSNNVFVCIKGVSVACVDIYSEIALLPPGSL